MHSTSFFSSLRLARLSLSAACAITLCLVRAAIGHDTWIETNASTVRAGDAVYIDLKLGNHGNAHRDFKQAGKVDLSSCEIKVRLPNGVDFDLRDQMHDLGYAPQEGYWSGKFVCTSGGTHIAVQHSDQILNHGRPVRSIKSAKCCFLVTAQLDRFQDQSTRWKEAVGHELEIVPVSHPILSTGPGMPVEVKVLRNGTPKANARVAFIPQGVTLNGDFDETYERMTDAQGIARFTPKTGMRLLIVTHERAENEKSADYDATHYSATLELLVSEICPCCQ